MELLKLRPPPGSSALSPRAPPPAFQLARSPLAPPAGPPNIVRGRSRHSPRQHKLQRVPPLLATPATPFRDPSPAARARHDLFQFHQLLRDVVASTSGQAHATASVSSAGLSSQCQRDWEVLALLTSDRGDAALRELFRQWRAVQQQQQRPLLSDNDDGTGAVLWEVLDTLFLNLPLVIPEREAAADPRGVFRYVDALKALREVLVALLFTQPGRPRDVDGDEYEEEEEEEGASPRRFSATPRRLVDDARASRLPLFERCRQLERELQTLRRRASIAGIDDPVARGRRVCEEDVGLLHAATEALLLEFWQLPRGERLGFLSQVTSQAAERDAAAILTVFIESSSAHSFACAWDALQACPQFARALATAASAIAAQSQAAAATPSQSSESPSPSAPEPSASLRAGGQAPLLGETHDDARRATLRTPGKRTRHRSRDSRLIDLNGITEGFDDTGERSDGSASGEDDEDRHGGGRRLKKLFIRERGRTPPSSSAAGRRRRQRHPQHKSHRHDLDEHDEDGSGGDEGGRKRPHRLARADSGLTLAQKLHGDLVELIKEEYSPADHEALRAPAILDAGWKLLEALESHRSGSKSGYHQRTASLASTASVEPPVSTSASGGDSSVVLKPLTEEQQFMVKVDQLQAVLGALASSNVEGMGADVITSVYRRLPSLSALFASVSRSVSEAAGVTTPAYDLPPALAPSTSHGGHARKASSYTASPVAPPGGHKVEALDVDAVSELLGKLSKFVRSLVPVVELGDGRDNDHALAIMQLADDLEVADVEQQDSAPGTTAAASAARASSDARRRSSIEFRRRLEIMSRLRALAQSSAFEHVATAITATVNDVAQARVALLATIEEESAGGRPRPSADDEDERDDAEDEVDEVIRLAKSAKSRRVSVRAAGTSASASKADEEESEDDGVMDAVARSNRDIPMNIRHANAAKGIKLFSVGILLRVIDQLYRDNYECTVPTLQYGNRRMEFSEFLYDWHIRKYGLKALAQRHLLKLIQSLRKYERKVFQCQLCLRFLGIQNPLGYHEHKFVLGLLDRWSLGTFSGASRHRVALSKQQFKVRVAFAVSSVHEALSERFGLYFRSADAVAQRIRGGAIPGDDEFIRENELLQIAVDEWLQQRERIAQVLQAVYVAGDLNGDGSLELDEFAAVLAHLAPGADDRFAHKAFAAAHDHVKPRRISFERFLDVVLLERVLSLSGPGGSAAKTGAAAATAGKPTGAGAASAAAPGAGAGSDDRRGAVQHARMSPASTREEEEAYQFSLLQETWANDREAVVTALKTGIPHAPTAATLGFRVAFLDQLLAKRVDAATAWLCHRQILREVGRYQHLDAEQIEVLQTKEARFKKAVLAIRNMQSLGAQFLQFAAAKRVDGDGDGSSSASSSSSGIDGATASLTDAPATARGDMEPTPADGEAASYTRVVDQTLSVEEEGEASGGGDDGDDERPGQVDAVVAALEQQLRQQFVERADERAIDDFMAAMQRLRRASLLSSPLDAPPDVFRGDEGGDVVEDEGVDEEEEQDDEDEEADEEEAEALN